jgi:pimeloyl-ACP methyl ester carboxylesterase
MPTDAFVTANALRLHYVDFGGQGWPTLAIHGIASGGWSWQEVATGLAGGARVIAPDLRGHADSQWAPDGS